MDYSRSSVQQQAGEGVIYISPNKTFFKYAYLHYLLPRHIQVPVTHYPALDVRKTILLITNLFAIYLFDFQKRNLRKRFDIWIVLLILVYIRVLTFRQDLLPIDFQTKIKLLRRFDFQKGFLIIYKKTIDFQAHYAIMYMRREH